MCILKDKKENYNTKILFFQDIWKQKITIPHFLYFWFYNLLHKQKMIDFVQKLCNMEIYSIPFKMNNNELISPEYQQIIQKYNFPSKIEKDIMELMRLQDETNKIPQKDSKTSGNEDPAIDAQIDELSKRESMYYKNTFLPNLISLLQDRDYSERENLCKNLDDCNGKLHFLREGDSETFFHTIELLIQNFNISPKQGTEEGKSVIAEFKLRIKDAQENKV